MSTSPHSPDMGVPPFGSLTESFSYRRAIESYLCAAETASQQLLVTRDIGLSVSPAGVRRRGSAWFLGAPFFPGADVDRTDEVPEQFVHLLATWLAEQRSQQWIARQLMSRTELTSHPDLRNSGLRWIFAAAFEEVDRIPWIDALSVHPDAAVRAIAVGLLAVELPRDWAARRLISLTHDVDDRVFLHAFRAIGVLRVSSAWGDLLHITPSPSQGMAMSHMNHDAHPVGLGAAHCVLALIQIVNSDDPAIIRAFEAEHRPSAGLDYERFESRSRMREAPLVRHPVVGARRSLDTDWVRVPPKTGGPFQCGGFVIARDPVTNAMYDEFVLDFARAGGPEFEHPLQPPGKMHTRTTVSDKRFGPLHPVAGIDWFDAYAFCRFYGLRLPSDIEWDWAAIGPAKYLSGQPHCLDRILGPIDHINVWRRLLNEMRADWPNQTTAPVDDSFISGFGLRHAFGNVWEYTNSNFFTRCEFDRYLPNVDLSPTQYMSLWPFHLVLKGGAWSSIGNLTSPGYGGTDLYSDRHCEIGFRVARA